MDWTSQNIVSLWQATVPLLQTTVWVLLIGLSIKQFAPEIRKLSSRIKKIVHKGTTVYLAGNLEDADKVSKEKRQETQKQLDQKPESDYTSADWFNAAFIAYGDKRYEAALHNLEQALRFAETKEEVAKILFNQGWALEKLGHSEKAIVVYEEVNKRYGQDTDPGIRKQVANSLLNKGFALGNLNRPKEAIAVYNEIDRRYGQDTELGIRERGVDSLFNKGAMLRKLNRPKEAIAVYDEIDRRYGQETDPGIREVVARSLFNKGVELGKLGHFEEERAVLRKAKAIFIELEGLSEFVQQIDNNLQKLEKKKSQ